MRHAFVLLLSLAAVAPLAAQTVVTPTSLNGWTLDDGKGNGDAPTITGTKPFDGNGSLQFAVSNTTTQPEAFIWFNPVAFSSFNSLGYSFFADLSQVSTPTIRLLVGGLSNTGTGGSSFGSVLWYGVQDANWQTANLTQNVGNFFFRISGKGQLETGCSNTTAGQDFNDLTRRQTYADWISNCNGVSNNVSLATAFVYGVQLDYGTFPNVPTTTTVYADDVNFAFAGGPQGSYNFETSASAVAVTPEPATFGLLATGLVGIAGGSIRRRRKK